MLGGGFNKGAEEERIRVGDGEEELAGVEDCLRCAGRRDEFGEKRKRAGFAG